jgi:hypothetical protein
MKFHQMDPIWQNLPDDLAFLVISFMNIDTRLAFKVPPNRLGFKQVEQRFGREQVRVIGKGSRYTFKWQGGFCPKMEMRNPLRGPHVLIFAEGEPGGGLRGRWTMYVMNKDHTTARVTYYGHDTNKTHEYNIVRNGIVWNIV